MKNENLSFLDIKKIILSYYNLNLEKIEEVKHSSTNCYIITCSEGKYFIKIFEHSKNISKIEQEYDLLNYLKYKGFIVPSIIKTNQGEIYKYYKNHYIFLENYIKGQTLETQKISKDVLMNSAKLLGQIHKSMVGIYDDNNKESFWKCIDIEKEEAFLNTILKMLEKTYDDNNYLSIRNAINHKKNLLSELKKISKSFNGLTYLMTHGDYSKRNLIYNDEGNIVVVDFSDSGVYPVAWEVIRSYFFSTESCKNDIKFDYDLFAEYVKTYLKEFKLNISDIELMPYLFLYQITLSRYGYREYINNKDVRFLNFIEWKENIAYFLEENAEKIVKKLKI